MTSILLIFASSHGQTRKIAAALARRWRRAGYDVDLRDAATDLLPPPIGYDAVVIGSRVEIGHFAGPVVDYVERHRDALCRVRSAFFSVSMSAAPSTKGARSHAPETTNAFLAKARWQPEHVADFAGGLPYTQYGAVLRFVMKQISRAEGHPTDTSRDHELTNWMAVAEFADRIAAALAAERKAA